MPPMPKEKKAAILLKREVTDLEEVIAKMERAREHALVPAVKESLKEAADKLRENVKNLRRELEKLK